MEEAIYFICQEALNNAIVHGHAKSISIVLSNTEAGIDLIIVDDGNGSAEIVENKGLRGIRERVQLLKGSASYSTPEDGGFAIRVSIPAII